MSGSNPKSGSNQAGAPNSRLDVDSTSKNNNLVVSGPVCNQSLWHDVSGLEERGDLTLAHTACGHSYVTADVEVEIMERPDAPLSGTTICYDCVRSSDEDEATEGSR